MNSYNIHKKEPVFKIGISFLFLFLAFQLQAKHLIGGDITYVCNGNDSYTITMKVYRDCTDPTGAPYDNVAAIGIFRGQDYLRTEDVSVTNIKSISPEEIPCIEITNPPCVESGTYRFTITLPQSSEAYTIAYQRCCRNVTINNIATPGDVGATYSLSITPAAQQFCNNSPVFKNFPPTVICAGEPLDFDHGATDSNGDELRYSFCSPLIGGGNRGTADNPGSPTAFDGVAPNPPSNPPYNTVTFLSPNFASTNPMNGQPRVSINPQTGVITGTPERLGQYVVGVCVQEFRNGIEIGSIQRDFQFNVISCERLVDANVERDTTIGADTYLIRLCGDSSHSFVNTSIVNTPNPTYDWNFDFNNGDFFNSNDVNVAVDFPGTGRFSGSLIVNKGLVCTDTATILVDVFPPLKTNFGFDYDTCIAGPVTFTDSTVTEVGLQSWLWDFKDGNTSREQNPLYEYSIPGDFEVGLTVRDINGCVDTISKNVSYYPAPETLVIDLSGFEGCAPETVHFKNLSYPVDSTYTILWNFGDGATSTEISPSHVYEESGSYSVALSVISPIGCEVKVPYNAVVQLKPTPKAGFSFTPEKLNNFSPDVTFIDESVGAEAWLWDFGDGSNITYEQNPSHSYDVGTFEVMQVVRHASGCRDTATATIISERLVKYYLPNAFTPNSDTKNDEFKGTGSFEGMENFEMTIWNRWGELLFTSTDPNVGWNGRINNEGEIVQKGVYVVVVRYSNPQGENIEIKGFATLIR